MGAAEAAPPLMAVADLAVGLLAASRWRLTHLAVGTFGGCQMAVRAKWLLAHLAVGTFGGCQMAVGTFGGQGRSLNRIWTKWLLGHLAARADPYNMGQMAVGTFGGQDILRLCF